MGETREAGELIFWLILQMKETVLWKGWCLQMMEGRERWEPDVDGWGEAGSMVTK